MARRKSSKPTPKNRLKGKDILSVDQFTTSDLSYLFLLADFMRGKVEKGEALDLLKGKIMTALFYEPSSRTYGSFIAAMQLLSGGFIPIQGVAYSSVAKGESLPDTVRTFERYSDVIVIRHPEVGSAKIAAAAAQVPIINAGDGTGEHPTQALLDLYTIENELGRLSRIKVILGGDLLNGRTVHSLSKLLALYPDNELIFVSPEALKMPKNLTSSLKRKGAKVSQTDNLEKVIRKADVIYWTRIQKERFAGQTLSQICDALGKRGFDLNEEHQELVKELSQQFSQVSYEEVRDLYIITPKTLKKAKKKMILMHPLPRVNEISLGVDKDPRAVYFEQMRNGKYIRMALLATVLGRVPPEFSS